MSILIDRYFRRSRAVEELAEDWQIKHKTAMLALDVEELAGECIDLGTLASHVWQSVVQLLFAGKIKNIDEAGSAIRLAFAATRKALAVVANGIKAAESHGFKVEKASEFHATLKSIEEMATQFERVWPRHDAKMAEKSLAAFQRGESEDSGSLLRDAQGSCP